MNGETLNEAIWYYIGSFGQLGPLTREQMEELIEGGVIERETYVWKTGMSDWVPASTSFELSGAFAANQPPPTPPPFNPPSAPNPFAGSGAQFNPPSSFIPPASSFPPPTTPPMTAGRPMDPYQTPMMHNPNPQAFPAQAYYRQGMAMHPAVPKSTLNRTLGGILQFLLPGAGRLYLGYTALGALQFVLSIASCGILYLWSLVDGILILAGQVRYDGYGRSLDE